MAQPIYKSFFVRFKEPWYQLSKAEQDDLLKKVGGALEEVGGKSHVICASGWSSEGWQFFGLEQYPSIEAVQQHNALLSDLDWFRYIDSFTALGTEFTTT